MTELKIGQEVEMEYGGTAVVEKVIGSGGQGVVYLVEYTGMKWALKCPGEGFAPDPGGGCA